MYHNYVYLQFLNIVINFSEFPCPMYTCTRITLCTDQKWNSRSPATPPPPLPPTLTMSATEHSVWLNLRQNLLSKSIFPGTFLSFVTVLSLSASLCLKENKNIQRPHILTPYLMLTWIIHQIRNKNNIT